MSDTSSYDIFIDILKPSNKFAGKALHTNTLTFNEVEVIKAIFRNPSTEDIKELFCLLFDIRGNMSQSAEDVFYNTSVFELFKAKTFIQDFIKDISSKENDWLSGEPDEKMLMINASNRIAPFSHVVTRINLGHQFGCKPKDIGLWKYSEVFSILVANKIVGDLQKEYNEIK